MAVFQDLSGRAAGPRPLRLRGVVVVLAVVLVMILVQKYYAGSFTKSFKIRLEATSIGEGLAAGADVKYRGLIIGTVESIDTRGTTHQNVLLSLDPNQAQGLHGIVSAKYQASNVFGSPAIELLSGNSNAPLVAGATIKIDSSGKVASVTNSLRQISSLTTLLGTDKIQRLLRLVTQNGDILASSLKASFSLAKLYADNLHKPVVSVVQDAIPIVNGFDMLISPAVRELGVLYANSEFLADPQRRNATVEALLNQRIMIFDELATTLDHVKSDGADSLGFLIDIGHPLVMSAGSAASAWGNLETFLNRVEDAMPTIDGKVKLRLEVLLPASRALPDEEEADGQAAQAQTQTQQSQILKQLSPEQRQQVQQLQTQILGSAPQQAQQSSVPQAQQSSAPQQQTGDDFAAIPAQQSAGGPR